MNPNNQQASAFLITPAMLTPGIITPRTLAATPEMANGDLYFSTGAVFTRLPIGDEGNFLQVTNGIPSWEVGVLSSGWSILNTTLTYSSTDGHTFVVIASDDMRSIITTGDKITLTNNGAAFYGFVTAITATTITLYGGTQYTISNHAITSIYYSHAKSPFGFPTRPDYWTEELSDATDRSQAASAGVWYNLGSLSLAIPIGLWRVEYFITARFDPTGTCSMLITLSTANNSASDPDFTSEIGAGVSTSSPASIIIGTVSKAKILSLTSKTTYFVNAMEDSGSFNIYFRNSSAGGKLFVRAICAYL